MTPQQIKDNEAIVCWSCDKEVLIKELSAGDGFCPYCQQEIDLDEH